MHVLPGGPDSSPGAWQPLLKLLEYANIIVLDQRPQKFYRLLFLLMLLDPEVPVFTFSSGRGRLASFLRNMWQDVQIHRYGTGSRKAKSIRIRNTGLRWSLKIVVHPVTKSPTLSRPNPRNINLSLLTPVSLDLTSKRRSKKYTFSLLTQMSLDLTSRRRSKQHNFFFADSNVFRFELTAEKLSGPSPAVAEEEAAAVKSETRKPRGPGRPPVAEVTAQVVQPPYWDLPAVLWIRIRIILVI